MTTQVNRLVQDLRRKLGGDDGGALRDAELLRWFVLTREEDAFALLVERHGPMIFGLCRRILQNSTDADDAFQATFLVLARQAGRIRKPASLAAWLHGIALRLALNMKRAACKRQQREQQVPPPAPLPAIDPAWCELRAGLDEEMQRLPFANRQPLVLCYLEGMTQEEAARQLGWPRGTLKRRLERGRELLRARLTRRGLTLGAAVLATVPASEALALPVSPALAGATVGTACRWTVGGIAGSQAERLAQGVMKAMFLTRLASWSAMLLMLSLGAGIALVAYSAAGPPAAPAVPVAQRQEAAPQPKPHQPGKDADETVKERFEALARALTIFQTQDFAHGRTPSQNNLLNRLAPKELLAPWVKANAAISANRDPSADLVALLKHKDPIVRTLALAALHERQDPRLLPHLAALLGDTAKTAPEVVIVRAIPAFTKDQQLHPEDRQEQTVGHVVEVLLDQWLAPAGYRAQDFATYWAARKDRAYCGSWFLERIHRAEQGTSGYDKKLALTRMRSVRKDVDGLPEPDRDWMLLWLAANITGSEELRRDFAEPQELLAAGKRLGPDRLMKMIQGGVISDDPDMGEPRRTSRRAVLIRWVLQHAGALLRPADTPALLDAHKTARDPWYVLAAAELQPQHARAWLHAAMASIAGDPDSFHRQAQRAELAAGLWRLVGVSEMDYLANWFFGERVAENPRSTQMGMFLDKIKGVRAPADRRLVARLITDPRLDRLDYQSLKCLIWLVNGWSKQPAVSNDSLFVGWERGSWAPETPSDFAVLADWRAQLRASVKEWAPAAK